MIKRSINIVATASTLLLVAQLYAQQSDITAIAIYDDESEATTVVDTLEIEVEHNIATFKEQLTAEVDSLYQFESDVIPGRVTIHEDDSSQSALESYASRKQNNVVNGYRVGVYFNNSAQARSGAMEVMKRCEMLLQDIPATMSYDNPYFKVSVGYCISEEEAVIMLNRVQRYFPKAYLMRERITIENLVEARAQETQEIKPQSTTQPTL